MDNRAETEYTVHFSNGSSISGKMNTTPEVVRKIFSVGSFQNVGFGPYDNIQRVTSVEIHCQTD